VLVDQIDRYKRTESCLHRGDEEVHAIKAINLNSAVV
jgi:hypothetical protein